MLTTQSKRSFSAVRPTSACPSSENVPSSPILPSTAKRLPVQESSAAVCRAACMESGLALYVSSTTRMPLDRVQWSLPPVS